MMACQTALRYKMKNVLCVSRFSRFLPLVKSRCDINVSQPMYSSKGSRHVIFRPFWEPGSGHFGSTLGKLTEQVLTLSEELVLSCIDTITVNPNGVFTIADYGTNDGYASMSLMNSIIGKLRRKHGEQLPIQIIYEDQAKNDFNSLFNRLSDNTSYMPSFSNVYPFATNISFYDRCVPDETCDVILTSMATHYLDNVHFKFMNNISHVTAPEEELCQFRVKAEQDWINFLVLRAKELKPGGILMASNLSASDHAGVGAQENGIPENTEGENITEPTEELVDFTMDFLGTSAHDVFYDLEAAWKQLKIENVITKEELENCTVNYWMRKGKEWRSPFDAVNSSVRAAGLNLVHHDQVFLRCPFKNMWWQKLLKEGVDDRRYFAVNLINAHRVWSHSTFEKSLSDARSTEEKSAILDRLYEIATDIVSSKDPRTYKCDYVVSRLAARKKK